jgi:glycosyltransferase involved in cell wall biosynthesis
MKKIKLLYIITSTGFGGAERLLLSYLKLIDHDKYKLYVCSLREKPNDLENEISKYAEFINLKIESKFNPAVLIKLIKLINSTEPDIIHTHLFQARIYTALASMFTRSTILVTHKHNNVNLKKHNIFILLERISIAFYSKVIAISESVAKSLSRYELIPARKIFVLHNGIDFQNFNIIADSKGISNKNGPVIGIVCRLEPQKGINYLLLAMRIILAKFPTAKLEIVGDGSLFQELKQYSKNLGISNSVKFFGKFADVISFYKRMDVFVLPSLYEGFGIVLLEAMAAGVPVVATNVDGINEVVVDGVSGILVQPKSPEAIANAILKIIENDQLAESFKLQGYERAKSFEIKEHVHKLQKFYSMLLGVES